MVGPIVCDRNVADGGAFFVSPVTGVGNTDIPSERDQQ